MKDNLNKLEVYGIISTQNELRPVFLLKCKKTKDLLPVWINPLEISTGNQLKDVELSGQYFHQITKKVLNELNAKITKCVFVEVVGFHQYVKVYFTNSDNVENFIKVRADEAMSLCLSHECEFYSTQEIIALSQRANTELMEMSSLNGVKNEMNQGRYLL